MSYQTSYKCKTCKSTGVKLWRDYQTIDFNLQCAKCLGVINTINSEGMVPISWFPDARTDQIESKIPAVPVKDSDVESYWGYTSVPLNEMQWWKSLPNK